MQRHGKGTTECYHALGLSPVSVAGAAGTGRDVVYEIKPLRNERQRSGEIDHGQSATLVAVFGQVDDPRTIRWHDAVPDSVVPVGGGVGHYGRETASPPARVDNDRQTGSATSSMIMLTDPSIIATLTDPG